MAAMNGTVLTPDAHEGLVALLSSALEDIADGDSELAVEWIARARRQLLDA